METVKRQNMAAFLYRLAGSPAFEAPAESPFSDVDASTLFLIAFIFRKSRDKSFGFHDDCFAS